MWKGTKRKKRKRERKKEKKKIKIPTTVIRNNIVAHNQKSLFNSNQIKGKRWKTKRANEQQQKKLRTNGEKRRETTTNDIYAKLERISAVNGMDG